VAVMAAPFPRERASFYFGPHPESLAEKE
jgi:hypothetical protein